MARRGSSARAAALRRAQQAKAARNAARLRREKDIEAALADYFEATERAGRIRAEGRRKADRILADVDLAAEAPRRAASAAIRRLRDLVGTATEVASLCGISAAEVRATLARPVPSSQPGVAADEPGQSGQAPDGLAANRAAEPGTGPTGPPRDVPGHGLHQETAGAAGDEGHG